MAFDQQAIASAAPDAASLKAGQGLVKPAKWPLRGRNDVSGLIWGECQGSGANPYRVMADVNDLGSKCTCPSRKFPCKHALALMLMRAAGDAGFVEAEPPDWVADWVGRRRKTAGGAPAAPRPTPAGGASTADLAAALAETSGEPVEDKPEDPALVAKREAAAAKRAEATRQGVEAACGELEGWIHDQIRSGLGAFLDDLHARTRRIAARMADAKAATLASRIDEAPARLLNLPSEERIEAAVKELGKLLLLTRAWRAAPEDSELRRELIQAEAREGLLESADAPRSAGVWEALEVITRTRRDGLVAQSSWFLNLSAAEGRPRFAMLQDVFPASAGRRSAPFSPGDRFAGEMVYYPARNPLRAQIGARDPSAEVAATAWPPAPADDPLAQVAERLLAAPWSLETPLLLGPGAFAADPQGRTWWRAAQGGAVLPLAEKLSGPIMGAKIDALAGLWTGARLEILATQIDWEASA